MPIIYKRKDVTAEIANGTFDTKAVAAELRAGKGMAVEGGRSRGNAEVVRMLVSMVTIHSDICLKTREVKRT